MPIVADRLRKGSFRGVPFLVPSGEAEGGRMTILHDYPDSSYRYAEDNGGIAPIFHVTAIVHGRDVLSWTNRLRQALDAPGPATLQHPYFGAQFVQVQGPYRVRHDDTDLGVVTFEIDFAVTGAPVFPSLGGAIASTVSGLSATFLRGLFAEFQAIWVTPAGAVTRTMLADGVTAIADAFAAGFGAAAEVVRIERRVAEQAAALVDDAAALGDYLHDLWRAPFDDAAISNAALVTGFRKVWAACEAEATEASRVSPDTLDKVGRADSLNALATIGLAACLASGAEAMAGKTYVTTDEIDYDEQILLAWVEAMTDRSLKHDLALELKAVTDALGEVMAGLRIRLPRIEDLAVVEMPASVLAYMLYDSGDDTQTLIDLNLGQTPLLFDGEVKVLADG